MTNLNIQIANYLQIAIEAGILNKQKLNESENLVIKDWLVVNEVWLQENSSQYSYLNTLINNVTANNADVEENTSDEESSEPQIPEEDTIEGNVAKQQILEVDTAKEETIEESILGVDTAEEETIEESILGAFRSVTSL